MCFLINWLIQLINTIIYHSTIKMRPIGVKSITYVDFGIENNEKDFKFKVDDHVKVMFQNGLKKFL